MNTVKRAGREDGADWCMMRDALWPHATGTNAADIAAQLNDADLAAFIAYDTTGRPLGFAEAAIRRDYVNGCTTSPVGFLEGVYVVPEARRQGVASQLIAAVESWVREQGCSELASDAAIDNTASHKLHEALGFAETQRVVFFRRLLL